MSDKMFYKITEIQTQRLPVNGIKSVKPLPSDANNVI